MQDTGYGQHSLETEKPGSSGNKKNGRAKATDGSKDFANERSEQEK